MAIWQPRNEESITKYLYLDCRRKRPDLIIRAPKRYYDTSHAAVAFLIAKQNGFAKEFMRKVFFEVFQNRMEPDDVGSLSTILNDFGARVDRFDIDYPEYYSKVDDVWSNFIEKGGFGIPSLFFGKELFWGGDRIPAFKKCFQNKCNLEL